jgi:signal peptidase I
MTKLSLGQDTPHPHAKKGFWREIRELAVTLVAAGLLALGIRSFAFEPFNIPSGSMIPTLLVGDFLFVNKFSYGYSSKSAFFDKLPFQGRLWAKQPERGDVIVFKYPPNPSQDYIKRLIGMPGDHIQMRQGRLYINDAMVERQAIEDYVGKDGLGREVRYARYMETLPGGRQHVIIETDGDKGIVDTTQEWVVPEGHYFMMGDNRDNSSDSRLSVGFVPFENLVGRASFLFFSLDHGTRFYELYAWPQSLRYERLFSAIH